MTTIIDGTTGVSTPGIVNTGTDSVTGNTTTGNLLTSGLISATGNVTGGNIVTSGAIVITGASTAASYSATGNITGGNILTVGIISATANVTGSNLLTGGLISATGNIQAGNVRTAGVVSATGNINGGNVLAGGLISATSTVSANSFIPTSSSIPTNGVYLPATNTIGIATNSTARIQVNASGLMTNAYQPGFLMYANDAAFTGTTLPYSASVFNIGSNFNTSTYTFTAPITGVYIFSWQFFSPPNLAANVDFYKNAATLGRYGPEAGTITNYCGWSGSIIVPLSAGDTTKLIRNTGTIHLNPNLSYFSGFLLG